MINRDLIDPKRLLDAMLDSVAGNVNHWHRLLEIVPDYVAPFAKEGTRPKIVVRCLIDVTEPLPGPGIQTSRYSYLRCGAGGWNNGGYFWDCYGEEFYSVEYAFLAALHAPVPPGLLKRTAWLKEVEMQMVVPRTWCERCRQPNSPFPCAGCPL